MTTFLKDPNEELDYGFDWSSWLASGESIATYSLSAEAGITLGTNSVNAGIITYWLSGGTEGETYKITCQVETNEGRIGERTMRIRVLER
jgi:hypothetical protein